MVAAAFNTSLVCMPMILIFGQMRGAYLGGSLLTFFLGYCILFFKSGFLLSAYPFSAALILAGFDMQEYNGATQAPSVSVGSSRHSGGAGSDDGDFTAFPPQQKKQAITKRKKSKRDAAGVASDERSEFMRKLNYTGKICVVLCAILCVGSLSGCSTAMQSLADGTDAVLNGLADGTDIVLNGLSEGADQALGGLSEADDGQAKDSIVNAFGELVGDAGNAALTPQSKLQGHKENGVDDYTGAYEATYSEFTGTEILFGGTTLEREAGSTIHITCSLSLESGEAAVFLRSGADDPVILLSESGEYDGTIEVDGTSTYIGVWGDQAEGTVSIEIE